MQIESFFSYRDYRWFWLNFALVIGSIAAYSIDSPIGGPGGDTYLGIILGIIGAVGMVVLMWYSARKRSYRAKYTTLKGSLSLHVWLGISLVVVVTLHAGFSFGWNVHTLAYVLMLLTILTGIWGGLNYHRLAGEIESHRGGASIPALLEQLHSAEKEIKQELQGKSDQLQALGRALHLDITPDLTFALFKSEITRPDSARTQELMRSVPDADRDEALRIIAIHAKKVSILNSIRSEVRTLFLMRAWLYLHLPLAAGAFMALIIHIASVIKYW